MTMEAMAGYLAARDFAVEKKYDKNTQSYKFYISKDGWCLTRYFKYPASVEPVVRDRIQREFLDEMIEKFNSDVAMWKPTSNGIPVSKIIDDMIKNATKKGEEMGTRRINWKVERVEATSDAINPGLVNFNARLTGTSDPLFTGYAGDVKNDLQNHLNKYMENDDRTIDNPWAISWPKQNPFVSQKPTIKDVIFNDPATIVFWSDGTKTVVKCQEGDSFDPEKGLAMAIVKKVLGNKGNYCNEIKKWTKPYEDACEERCCCFGAEDSLGNEKNNDIQY